tara:strand:- start:246 stop:1244 length:999 start_codon:yes stop_codon:yes gene_type:complete
MEKIKRFIENKINIGGLKKFAVIIGETPSQGARSPKLWNNAYRAFNKKCKMYPIDVYEKNLENLIIELKKDKRFIGGSVTAPYKEKIIKYLDGISPESKKIGSINTLIKKNNKIFGENTDYYGALNSLKQFSNKKNILVFGCGGAGKSVILACMKQFKSCSLKVYNRDKKKILRFTKNLKNKNAIRIISSHNYIKKISRLDLIINTTSVGFDSWVRKQKKYKNLKFFNPISNIKKLVYSKKKNEREFVNKNLRIINKNLIETYKFLSQNSNASVFDIIYNPSLTQLINHAKTYGMRTINGLEMNLYQAIKAFKIVNNIQNENKIRIAMIKNG